MELETLHSYGASISEAMLVPITTLGTVAKAYKNRHGSSGQLGAVPPIELGVTDIIDQNINYIHDNPVEAGFVDKQECYLYRSGKDYAGEKDLIEINFIE